jgi:hypothetical protein
VAPGALGSEMKAWKACTSVAQFIPHRDKANCVL